MAQYPGFVRIRSFGILLANKNGMIKWTILLMIVFASFSLTKAHAVQAQLCKDVFQSEPSVAALELSAFLDIQTEMNLGKGATNGGVFRATTYIGPGILKLNMNKQSYRRRINDEIALQNTFAELGLSPRILGTISPETIDRLFENGLIHIDNPPPRKELFIGLFMTEVPGGWNPKSWSKDSHDLPKGFFSWNRTLINQQMVGIVERLNRMEVDADDLQFLIDPNGKVFLIDLELFEKWNGSPTELYKLNMDRLATIQKTLDTLFKTARRVSPPDLQSADSDKRTEDSRLQNGEILGTKEFRKRWGW